MTTQTVLFNGPSFRLTSWGNGIAYCLTSYAEEMEVFLQGEDAAQFRIDLEATSRAQMAQASFQAIAQWLWDQCGYGDAALPVDILAEVA